MTLQSIRIRVTTGGVAGSDTASVNEPTSDIYPSEDGDTYDENMKLHIPRWNNFISEEIRAEYWGWSIKAC